MKTYIRSFLLYVAFFLISLLLLPVYAIVSYGLRDPQVCECYGRFYGSVVLFLLRTIVGINHNIEGLEKLKKIKGPFIIASKHQSVWETVAFFCEFPQSSFVLKREIKRAPMIGRLVQQIPMIIIDRKKPIAALQHMLSKAKVLSHDMGRNIIIFPEGQRRPVGASPNYSDGAYLLYKTLNVPVVCVSLNSGLFWPKHKFLKFPGTIQVRIESVIQPGLDRDQFRKKLVNSIESGISELAKVAP